MADVSVIVQLIGGDSFYPSGIITLTINSVPKSVSVTSYGWTTGPLTYADGLPLAIAVTTSPKYYCDANLNTTATEGTKTLSLTLVNPTLFLGWSKTIRPMTLGRPIINVDNILMTNISSIDDVSENAIMCIDGIYIEDGTWRIEARGEDHGLDWEITIIAP